jgi:hypothetical protein
MAISWWGVNTTPMVGPAAGTMVSAIIVVLLV